MTSQPSCENGHGLMVPMGREACFAPSDGLVTVVVEWQHPEEVGQIVPRGYAVNDEAKVQLPSGDRMGDEIARLEEEGKLVSIYGLLKAGNGYLRIDDNRVGHNWGYVIWLGDERLDGVSFMPRTVYHWFDHRIEEHQFPALTDFDEVVALMSDPSVLLITEINPSLARKDRDDPEARVVWDQNNRVVVWDRSAMVQHHMAEKALESGED